MKVFFKCTLSALALSAVLVIALLSSGCNKNQESPSTGGDPTGDWYAEFYEEEMGGLCIVSYSFKDGGKGTFSLVSAVSEDDEDSSFPILWRVDGTDKLSLIPESEKEMYDNFGMEWPTVTFLASGETLQFIYDDEVASFKKAN